MSKILAYMGYHTTHSATLEKRKYRDNPDMGLINFLGYIPLIGMVVGGARIWGRAIEDSDASLGERTYHFIRGSIEFLGGGLLLLIPDLIVTIGRYLLLNIQNVCP